MITHYTKDGRMLADVAGVVISRADFPAVYALMDRINGGRYEEKGIADNPGNGAEADNHFRGNRLAN